MPNEQGINPNRDPVGAAALKWQDDPSGDRTRSLLSMIDVNVKPEVVRGWSKDQRREAEAYAHSVLLDHAHPTLSAPQAMPDFVAEAAHPRQQEGEPVRYPDDIGPRDEARRQVAPSGQAEILPWERIRQAARKRLNERLDVLVRAIHRAIRDFAGDSAVMADTYLHGAQRLTEIGLLALRYAAYCAVDENGVSYVTSTQVHRIAAFLEKSPRTFDELEATFRSVEDAEIAHILDKLVAAALQD